jgi:hypothetical protein
MNHSIEDEVNERDSIDINSITYPCNSYKMPPFENQIPEVDASHASRASSFLV